MTFLEHLQLQFSVLFVFMGVQKLMGFFKREVVKIGSYFLVFMGVLFAAHCLSVCFGSLFSTFIKFEVYLCKFD